DDLGALPDHQVLDPDPSAAPVTAVSVVGGRIRSVVPLPAADSGVWIGRLADAPDAEGVLGSVATEAPDVFALLNDARCEDPLLVRVAAGVSVPDPIVVSHLFGGEGTATFPRLVVQAGANSV